VATAPRPAEITPPPALADLPDPPTTLFALGSLATLDAPTVTIVGSRRATAYGERIARAAGAAFARAGVCVVSGLAYGIDIAAQRAALDAGGPVCAVLGTGLDVAYPVAHRSMQAAIAERGLVLSEYPAGTGPRQWRFPERNRLMAALGQATIVIEAGVSSGALLTAQVALDLGRAVGAVPGPIDSSESQGTNALLGQSGVVTIASIGDALDLLGTRTPAVRDGELPPDERAVWRALPATGVDDLVARTALPTPRCLAAMAALELARALTIGYDGSIRRTE
jgi:DNA processing protein